MASRPSLRALRRIQAPLRNTPQTRSLCVSTSLLNPVQPDPTDRQTHFGFETVPESEKAQRVAGVFHSVAESYDKMNDLMSFGWHRIWKCVPPIQLPPPISRYVETNKRAETTSSPPSPQASSPQTLPPTSASSTLPAARETLPSVSSATPSTPTPTPPYT